MRRARRSVHLKDTRRPAVCCFRTAAAQPDSLGSRERMSRRKQSVAELEGHLSDQLGFLKASADAYDEGFDAEAKRLAVSVRVLLHDTDKSHSLLGQLDRLGQAFVSTNIPHDHRNVSTHAGLVMIAAKGKSSKYAAHLDGGPYRRRLAFADWWNETVVVDDRKEPMTRRDVVLALANQDGGAHVDPKLNETYAHLTRENSLGWTYSDGNATGPILQIELATMRQVAHEVLATLMPGYTKKVEHKSDMLVGGAMVFDGVPPEWEWRRTTGRNDPCPCGSGKKYKKCHGSPAA